MKTNRLCCCLIALLLCSTNSFAQVRIPSLQGLQRAVQRGMERIRPATITVPKRLTPIKGKMVVKIPKLPTRGTAFNASYLYKIQGVQHVAQITGRPLSIAQIQRTLAKEWVGTPTHGSGLGKVLYEDETALATDLNNFYQGSGIAITAPNGELGKIYTLPVDGILYRPTSSVKPLELQFDHDIVIYYPRTKTGQLVKNTPEMQNTFNKPANSGSYEEITILGGEQFSMPSGEPDWNLFDGVETPKSQQPASTLDNETVTYEEVH